jgi:hypothetical protein
MLSRMRDPAGGPALRVRLLALLVVAGLVISTAPIVVLPIVRGVLHALF